MENLTNFDSICALLAVIAFCVAFVLVIYICAKYTYKADKEKNYQISRIADSLEHIQECLEDTQAFLCTLTAQQDAFFDISIKQCEKIVDAVHDTCSGVTK